MPTDPLGAVPEELRELSAPQERLHDLVEAIYSVVSDLDVAGVLRRLVTAATRLVDAEYGALGLLGDDDDLRLVEFVQVGMDAETVRRLGHWPQGRGVLGAVLASDHPVRLDDLTEHPAYEGWPAGHPLMTSFLGVPVRIRGRVLGDLYLADKRGGVFTAEDERIIEALAVVAAVKITNARMYEQVQQDAVRRQEDSIKIAVMEDRDRIARDLHDSVIQRIYAAGLTAQGALRLQPGPDVVDRLERVVAALDDTIQDIRATIFSIQSPAEVSGGLRSEITDLVGSAARHLGFTPTLRQAGPIDAVPESTGHQALAVLRESLSNVVRHADATRIDVTVTADTDELRVAVADNGIGLGCAPRRGGLRNIAERAAALRGTLELAPGLDDRGTALLWRVPLP
ncbi:MAG: Redox sensor histidine kinase response regulator DevS [Nocardia sp.]|uniref:GAF domain-containing sensor histidine kinase n=1 Tax=Nocardia sp. TaxID=1821 RepID=UPI00263065A6|nr:GAF domain-containing protein [Nocardia sp.]MCU1644009.1 Redox sensor histidine kinase response regulator DevS [Nocardia sp.]